MTTRTVRVAAATAAATLAAALCAASTATAATPYTVAICTQTTGSAGLWTATGSLSANLRGVECPASSGEPNYNPAAGNRGVFVLPHEGSNVISSAGDPFAGYRLVVPSSLSLTGGTVNHRGGSDSQAWRSWIKANDTIVAGCYPGATSGSDACAYDTGIFYFSRQATAQIPAGTSSLTVGLQCVSVRANGNPNSGCASTAPTITNTAYSAVTGGSLNVSDATAPTGTGSVAQVDAAGNTKTWTRSADARVRVKTGSIDDVGRGVCSARLERTDGDGLTPPLGTWSVTPTTDRWRQCDGLAVDQVTNVSSGWTQGVRDVRLILSDATPATAGTNRTTIATATVRTDDTAPYVAFDGVPTSAAGGTRVKVSPTVSDALSGVQSSTLTATTPSGPVTIENDEITVPAGQTVTLTATATDGVGLTSTATRQITGTTTPVEPDPGTPGPGPTPNPPATTPTTPAPPTTTPTTPTTPAPPTKPKPTGCAAAKRSAVSLSRWSRRTRRLQLQGCRVSRQKLRAEVRLTRRGRTITRRYSLAGTGTTWKRTLRTRAGETPRTVRLVPTGARATARRTITRTR